MTVCIMGRSPDLRGYAMTTDTTEFGQRPATATGTPLQVLVLALLPAILAFVLAQGQLADSVASPTLAHGEMLSSIRMFLAQDHMAAPLVAALILGAWLLAARTNLGALQLSEAASRRGVWILALTGAAAAWAAGRWAFHGFALSYDEVMPRFQAEIFRSGHLLAPIPPEMAPFQRNLVPFFTYVDEARGLWASRYRPGHAMLLALSPTVGGVSLLNPVLTALSVWAAGDIARRIWPGWTLAPVLAALLLLVTPQVLVTAGSGFSFPAHLAANLLWMAFFMRGVTSGRVGPHLAAAAVGAFAIGLHQVHVHPLFAAPFLAFLLIGALGRRAHVLPYVIAYGVALPLWVLWPELAVWLQTGDASVLPRSLGAVDYLADYLRYTDRVGDYEAPFRGLFLQVNLLRFVLWLSPGLVILAVAALLRPRQLTALHLAALASVLLTVAASHVLMPNQMQSWGSRYYHPILGNLVILAVAGADMLRREHARRLLETALLLIVASAVVLVPLRLLQAERKVGPRAEVQEAIAATDADIVLVPRLDIWFLGDVLRNGPALTNRPLIMSMTGPLEDLEDLPAPLRDKRIRVLTEADFEAFGLPRGTLHEPDPSPD